MKTSKLIGILGSSLGLLSTLTVVTSLVLADNGVIDFATDNVRSYHGEFYADEVLLLETTQKRGTKIDVPEAPQKEGDEDGNFYTFLGWDTSGNGIPDITPNYMYYNFTAKAVYANFKIPKINPEDIDWEKLLELMQKFNISLEDLMKFLNLSLDDLPKVPAFEFELSAPYSGPMIFRTESEGKWSPKKKKWVGSDYYNGNSVGIGDYQPLNFVADKLKNPQINSLMKMIGYNLDSYKYTYSFKYLKDFKVYPVPEYESDNSRPANSDCYALTSVQNNEYITEGYFSPYEPTLFNALRLADFPSDVKEKEQKYRAYAYEHYLEMPNEYSVLKTECDANGLVFNRESPDYSVIAKLAEYMESNYKSSMSTKKVSGDPILEINNKKVGNFEYLTTYAIFMFRSLGIPARIAHGFLTEAEDGKGVGYVGADLLSSCPEVYMDNLGWVVLNPLNIESAPEDAGSELGSDRDKLSNQLNNDIAGGSGDIQTQLSNKGPGNKGFPGKDGKSSSVIKFKSDYSGTVYFQSASYGDYSGTGWSNVNGGYQVPSTDSVSPFSYVNAAAKSNPIFKTRTFEVEYLSNMTNGLVPAYSESTQKNDATPGLKQNAGTKATFISTMIDTSAANISLLMNGASSNATAIRNARNKYSDYLQESGRYLDVSTKHALICQTTGLGIYRSELYSTFEKLTAIRKYLADNFTYNLDFDYGNSFSDTLDAFVYYKEGICQHFATFATLLCRWMGISARWVTGFASRSVAGQDCYVGPSTCHAWTEVFVDDVGWMIWDCTPGNFDYDRDVSKPQEEDDDTYGKGPGGGGIQTELNTMSLALVLPKINKVYSGSRVDVTDINYLTDIKIVETKGTMSHQSFSSSYRVVPQKVVKAGTDEPLYDYEAAIDSDLRADVYYTINDTKGNDVTNIFTNSKGGQFANEDGLCVFKNVKVQVSRRPITIYTENQNSDEETLAIEGPLVARITNVSVSNLTIDDIQYDSFQDAYLLGINGIPDYLFVDSFATLAEKGSIDASVSVKIYRYVDGEPIDITELYDITEDFGVLMVV